MSNPIIAIVGRPNVGKSTLFNRLVGRQAAVVTDVPGTTRDRISLETRWRDRSFIIVDTGGLEPEVISPMTELVTAQAEMAIEGADAIIFLTDIHDGVTPVDAEIGARLRQSKKPVALVVNKADNDTLAQSSVEFYQLGLGDPIPISAHHNRGVNRLMETVFATLPMEEEVEPEEGLLSLAIVGRVNVGKSALFNAILGEERAIVSTTPGTTRDAINTSVDYKGQKLLLIDTPGVRRSGRIEPTIERYSVLRTIRSIDQSDVVFMVLEASQLAIAQDTHVAGQVGDSLKGVVILVNKWDLATDLGLDEAYCMRIIRDKFKFMPYAPVRFVSALEGSGIDEALDATLMVFEERKRRVPQDKLYSEVLSAMGDHPPPNKGRRTLKVRRVLQEGVNPPKIVFYVNDPDLVHFSYRRYLENRLRESFGFRWTHLNLVFRGR